MKKIRSDKALAIDLRNNILSGYQDVLEGRVKEFSGDLFKDLAEKAEKDLYGSVSRSNQRIIQSNKE